MNQQSLPTLPDPLRQPSSVPGRAAVDESAAAPSAGSLASAQQHIEDTPTAVELPDARQPLAEPPATLDGRVGEQHAMADMPVGGLHAAAALTAGNPEAADPAAASSVLPSSAPKRSGTVGQAGNAHPSEPARRHPAWLLQRAFGLAEEVLVEGLSIAELEHVSLLAGRMKARMDSVLCNVAAEVTASGSRATATGVLQSSPHLSRQDAGRIAGVAEGLKEMPNVKDRLESGDITVEHANALVKTAKSAGPAAVDNNPDLLARAGEVSPDKFAQDAKRFGVQASEDRGEAELERQRKARRASTFTDPDTGMGRLSAEFDPIRNGLVLQALDGRVDQLRRVDRGIGRSMEQRRADALFELITHTDALTLQPLAAEDCKARPDMQLVVVADIGLIDGTDPAGRCEIPGVGPVPPSVLAKLSPDTEIAGMLFGGQGRPLWLGRKVRDANAAQRLALAVRDGGCVVCGAPMHLCEIHHVREWEQDGPTDIENLVALCRRHHRDHHGVDPSRYRGRSRRGPRSGATPKGRGTGGRIASKRTGGGYGSGERASDRGHGSSSSDSRRGSGGRSGGSSRSNADSSQRRGAGSGPSPGASGEPRRPTSSAFSVSELTIRATVAIRSASKGRASALQDDQSRRAGDSARPWMPRIPERDSAHRPARGPGHGQARIPGQGRASQVRIRKEPHEGVAGESAAGHRPHRGVVPSRERSPPPATERSVGPPLQRSPVQRTPGNSQASGVGWLGARRQRQSRQPRGRPGSSDSVPPARRADSARRVPGSHVDDLDPPTALAAPTLTRDLPASATGEAACSVVEGCGAQS